MPHDFRYGTPQCRGKTSGLHSRRCARRAMADSFFCAAHRPDREVPDVAARAHFTDHGWRVLVRESTNSERLMTPVEARRMGRAILTAAENALREEGRERRRADLEAEARS